jgi:hypothetical protein
MLSVMVNVCKCKGGGGKRVLGVKQGAKNGAVDPEHVTGKVRSSCSRTKGHHSKRGFLLALNHHTFIKYCICALFYCVPKNTLSSAG